MKTSPTLERFLMELRDDVRAGGGWSVIIAFHLVALLLVYCAWLCF